MKAAVNNQLEISAVCDMVPEHMEVLLAKHELQNDMSILRYTDYRSMIQEVKPDLVSIATESGIHAEIALFCIDHGVHVIIEKPMAMSISEGKRVPSEPVQHRCTGNATCVRSRTFWTFISWIYPCTLEQESGIL